MKRCIPKHLIKFVVIAFAVVFAGSAAAHGNRLGERITLTWTVDGTSDMFEVRAPVNPPLRAIKRYFVAKAGLGMRNARDYVVEKVVVTTNIPARDPSIVLPPGALPPMPPVTPVTDYVLLDETMSLQELGIVDGDTLRLREVEGSDADDNDEPRAHKARWHRRHDHDRRHHKRHHRGRHHRR